MKTMGIIAEYNPFHNGHMYHLAQSKQATGSQYTVVVMSGNFTQRGEPAAADKFLRTRMALLCGADVVVELPVYYATASAAYFAEGGVRLLDGMGIVDTLAFGSESGDLEKLCAAARHLCAQDAAIHAKLRSVKAKGMSYPRARAEALPPAYRDLLNEPNNILAIEYLKALENVHSPMKSFTLPRICAGYHSQKLGPIASASAIRANLQKPESVAASMPQAAFALLCEANGHPQLEAYTDILRYLLCTMSAADLREILDITEGLENRLRRIVFASVDDLLAQCKTKRYTHTRLRRVLLHILLRIYRADFDEFRRHGGPQYIRVLGFRRASASLLGRITAHAKLPLLTNLRHRHKLPPLAQNMLAKELEATDIYSLAQPTRGQNAEKKETPCKDREFQTPIVV